MDIDHAMIWDAVDELKSLNTESKASSPNESSDDEYSQYCIARKKTTPVVIVLPNGELHVCGGGEPCSFLQPNEEHLLICQYSGNAQTSIQPSIQPSILFNRLVYCFVATGVSYGLQERKDNRHDLNGGCGHHCGENMPDRAIHPRKLRYHSLASSRIAFKAATFLQVIDDDDDSVVASHFHFTNYTGRKTKIYVSQRCFAQGDE